jgi:serine/threonine protein kinase
MSCYLLLITSSAQQRTVFFDDRSLLSYWHGEILRQQGFAGNDRINQYIALGKLGEGSFGTVILSVHRFSNIKVALKIMNKDAITRTFINNN